MTLFKGAIIVSDFLLPKCKQTGSCPFVPLNGGVAEAGNPEIGLETNTPGEP